MAPKMRSRHRYGTLLAAAVLAAPAVWAGDEAPALEALLPELLRTDLGKPFPMAAIKFGTEFWEALDADAGESTQDNVFRRLFSGGLLFGIGPLNNVLANARGAEEAVRWTAPPTLKTSLLLQIDEPQVAVTVEGQVVPLKAEAPGADPNSLLNQLQFIFFPLRVSGGPEMLADMASSMTLIVTGLAPDAVQKFTWESATAPPQPGPGAPRQGPIVVQQQARPRHREGLQDQFDEAIAERMGWAPGAATAPAFGGAGLGGGRGDMEAAPEGPVLAAPYMAEAPVEAAAPLYPAARATSRVGAGQDDAASGLAAPLNGAFVTIDHVARTDGSVTVDYVTNSAGVQEVEVIDETGQAVERITGGPAPANGRALASWRPAAAKGSAAPANLAVTVRNWVQTPLGAQVSETTAPLPADVNPGEPLAAMAPQPPPVSDISVSELSVSGGLVQVRAYVAPVREPGGFLVPPAHITITNEAGDVVKQLKPTPPAPGKDYVFAWDATGDDGQPVPDGRYVLRIASVAQSDQGSARSEVRYWIDVPVEKTQRRLTALGPTAVETLQADLIEQKPGLVLLAYFAPEAGRLTASVVDALGRVVRRLVADEVMKGHQKLLWDGTDEAGEPLPDAAYVVDFELDGREAGLWWGAVALDGLEPSPDAPDTQP